MRLDKFLKVSRLIKRRTVAKEVADQGRIKINDRTAKSSTNVAEGDIIEIEYGNRIEKVRVDQLKASTKKEDALEMYTPLETVLKEETEETKTPFEFL